MSERPAADSAEDEAQQGRSATLVALGIVLSKLAGLVRQRVTAHYFGTSALADVIAAAFRIGNLAQNLLGEGTLSASFIPVYARLRAEGRGEEAVAFAQAALGALIATVIVVTAVGMAAAPWLTLLVAAGFDAERLEVTTRLVRLLFPMTGLLVLCAWALGVLNAHRRFLLPYAAPVIWSACQIGALIVAGGWLASSGEALAHALALGALVGAAIELWLLLWRARALIGRLRPRWQLHNASLREAARRLPGVLLGRGVIQISGLVDTLLVSFLASGATAVFVYAQTLYLLPMSVLGTGEAAASLPEMSADSAVGDPTARHARIRRRLGTSLSRMLTLSVPAVVVLVCFPRQMIGVLLQTGRFDTASTARVAEAVAVYGLALVANAGVRLLSTTLFALGDTRLPARFAVVRVVFSTAVALVLMRWLGVVGVVVGAASAGWLEAMLLGHALRGRLGGLGLEHVRLGRLAALAAVTVALPGALLLALPPAYADTFLGQLAVLSVCGAAFVAAARALGLLDFRALLGR